MRYSYNRLENIYRVLVLKEAPVDAFEPSFRSSIRDKIGSAPGGGYLFGSIADQLNISKEEAVDMITNKLFVKVFPGGTNPANTEEEYRSSISDALSDVISEIESEKGVKIKGASGSVRGYTARIISSLGDSTKKYGAKVSKNDLKQAVKAAEPTTDTKTADIKPVNSQDTQELVPAEEKDIGHEMELSEYYYGILLDKIEELNKKSARKKLPAVEIEKISEREEKKTDGRRSSYGYKDTLTIIKFRLVVPALKLSGDWEFVAVVEHMGAGNIITKAPDSKIDIPLHDLFGHSQASVCDHCNKVRRRTSTFIIKNSKGELKRVGKQCLKDYLGSDSAYKIISMVEYYDLLLRELIEPASRGEGDFDEREGGGGSSSPTWISVSDILQLGIPVVQTLGYHKRRGGFNDGYDVYDDSPTPTVDVVRTLLDPPRDIEKNPKLKAVLDRMRGQKDKEAAEDLINWAKEYVSNQLSSGQSNMSDYFNNLKVLLDEEFIRVKNIGVILSLIPQYKRHTEKKEQSIREARPEGDFVGVEGLPIGALKPLDKTKLKKAGVDITNFPFNGPIELTAMSDTQGFERQSYSYYDSGISYRTTFSDAKGNIYTLFSSIVDGFTKGDKTILTRAIIKKHNSYTPRGSDKVIKQNLITRPSFAETNNESAMLFDEIYNRMVILS